MNVTADGSDTLRYLPLAGAELAQHLESAARCGRSPLSVLMATGKNPQITHYDL